MDRGSWEVMVCSVTKSSLVVSLRLKHLSMRVQTQLLFKVPTSRFHPIEGEGFKTYAFGGGDPSLCFRKNGENTSRSTQRNPTWHCVISWHRYRA